MGKLWTWLATKLLCVLCKYIDTNQDGKITEEEVQSFANSQMKPVYRKVAEKLTKKH